jgi:cobalamin biosynthesis protein CobW
MRPGGVHRCGKAWPSGRPASVRSCAPSLPRLAIAKGRDDKMARIPTTVVTGFLGAGKTTLCAICSRTPGQAPRRAGQRVRRSRLRRLLPAGCGIRLHGRGCRGAAQWLHLLHGRRRFRAGAGKAADRPNPPEHILIETSGLALPKPLVKAFNWPAIRSRVTVDGVIAVVDGPAVAEGQFADDPEAMAAQAAQDSSVEHDNPLEEVFEDQILCADLILLNKSDLIDAEPGPASRPRSPSICPRRSRSSRPHGKVEPALIMGLNAAAESDLAAPPLASRRGRGSRP